MVALISLTTEVNTIKGTAVSMIGSTPVEIFSENDSLLNGANEKTAYYQAIVDSIESKMQSTFDYAYPKFQVFNKNIDSSTVRTFAGVMNASSLDTTAKHIKRSEEHT